MSRNGESASLRVFEIVGIIIFAGGVIFWFSTPGDVIVPPLIVIAIGAALTGIAHLMQRSHDADSTRRLVESTREQVQHMASNEHTSPPPTHRAAAAPSSSLPHPPALAPTDSAPQPVPTAPLHSGATPASPTQELPDTYPVASSLAGVPSITEAASASIISGAGFEPAPLNDPLRTTEAHAVINPETSAHELARIAASRPDLWTAIRAHPNAYEDLIAWVDDMTKRG